MLRVALKLASPGGANGRLSVLIFHRVLSHPDPLMPGEIDATRFDAVCRWVREWFNVLPADEAVARWRAGRLPPRAMTITFDDGYADNHDVALPILQRHGLQATFFVATGFMDGSCMWNDLVTEAVRRAPDGDLDLSAVGLDVSAELKLHDVESRRVALEHLLPIVKYLPAERRTDVCHRLCSVTGADVPAGLMMSPHQVAALHAAGMQIGAHTVTHPILARLQASRARDELVGSKTHLEDLTGAPVVLLAYPNGRAGVDYTSRDVDLARECGFEAAFSTTWGAASRGTDPFQLPRFTPWDRDRWSFGGRLVANLMRR